MAKSPSTEKIMLGTLIGAGVTVGIIAAFIKYRHRNLRGDVVLKNVKKLFAMDKHIEGSWIELKAVKKEFEGQLLDVYYGGITCKEDNQPVQYEFIANAKSGVLLDLYTISRDEM